MLPWHVDCGARPRGGSCAIPVKSLYGKLTIFLFFGQVIEKGVPSGVSDQPMSDHETKQVVPARILTIAAAAVSLILSVGNVCLSRERSTEPRAPRLPRQAVTITSEWREESSWTARARCGASRG